MSKARFRVVKSYNKTPSTGGIGNSGLDNTCLIINEDTTGTTDNGIYLGNFNKCIANYTSAGIGLTGDNVIKVSLVNETKSSSDASATPSTNANRLYPVSLDKSGKLAVNIPWTNPTALKNPYSLTIQGNGTSLVTYDGSSTKTVNITPSSIGALALTGGTLTGPLSMDNENHIVFNIPRCNENGGGWAVKQLIVNGHVDSEGNYPTVYSMGSYGQSNNLTYIFIGANEYSSTENLRIYPNGKVEAPTFTGDLIGYVTGNVTGNVNGNASTATKSGSGGGIWLYPENGNEVNFGGTSADSAVYFGYRTKDNKPIPTIFIFGSSTGTSQIKAAGFIKKDSSNSYVLLGGGGHKAVSDFATASKLGSSTIGAADRPIYLSGGSPVQTTYRMAGTNEVATTAIDISSAINTGIWYVNGTNNIYSQTDGVAIVNRYNDSWISQIYQDYRTGKLAVRGKNNGVWTEWKKIALTSDIPTSLPWSSITGKPAFTVDTSLSSTSTNPVQNKVINNALDNKADKSETILGYNLQERIEDLNLGTTNRFFRTGGSPDNAPGQNGYVVGLTMALNNDSDYRVQLAYDQSISRLSYRQQSGATSWGDWKKIALLTDIPTIGNGTITIKQNGTSKGTFTVNQTGNTTIELTDTTGITSQDHYKTSVAAGTAGTSSATSGSTLAVPYVTVNANGHVTGYGTHTHTISGFLTSHQSIYNLTMQAGAFSAVTFDPNGAAKTVNIPTKTSHLTNDSGFVDDKIKTPAITSFATWDGVTKFGLRAWSNNATSRPTDYGIALDFAGDNGGYNWRNRLAFATEGKGIHYYYATNNTTLYYGGRLITTEGNYTLNGNLTANAYYISSDERLKTFGDDIKVDFDELAKLRKSHFVFNDNPTKQEIGVSAQEVQKIYPEIVNETEEGTLSVDYSKLAVIALAAIDKLNQRIQELENKLIKYE